MKKLFSFLGSFAFVLIVIAIVVPQAVAVNSSEQISAYVQSMFPPQPFPILYAPTLKDMIVDSTFACKNSETQINPTESRTAYKTCLKDKIIAFIKEHAQTQEIINAIVKAGTGALFVDIKNVVQRHIYSFSVIRASLYNLTLINGMYTKVVTMNGIIYGGKKDGVWQFIFSQEPVECSDNFLKAFPGFPYAFLPECYDSTRGEKVTRNAISVVTPTDWKTYTSNVFNASISLPGDWKWVMPTDGSLIEPNDNIFNGELKYGLLTGVSSPDKKEEITFTTGPLDIGTHKCTTKLLEINNQKVKETTCSDTGVNENPGHYNYEFVDKNLVLIIDNKTTTADKIISLIKFSLPTATTSPPIKSPQKLSFTARIRQSLMNGFTIEEINNPNLAFPSDVNVGQIEKYFKLDNVLFALVLRNSSNVFLPGAFFHPSFVGVLAADQGDTQWSKLVKIKGTGQRHDNPYYLMVNNRELLLTIVDEKGGGSGEGLMKVFALSETGNWMLAGCCDFGASYSSAKGDYFAFSTKFSEQTLEPIEKCKYVQLFPIE